MQTIRTNKNTSKYAEHILDSKHSYGSLENAMKVLHLATKGKHMNTHEKFHIYQISKKGIHINEVHSDYTNPIYVILTKDQLIFLAKTAPQQHPQESLHS
jgi:hypothetical protein